MSYFDLYKKRVSKNGITIKEKRENEAEQQIVRNLPTMNGHHLAQYWDTTHVANDNVAMLDVDIVVKSGASEMSKTILFNPEDDIKIGAYVTYKNKKGKLKTYILAEINDDLILPTALTYFCNQRINFSGLDFALPCWSSNSSYGSKGLENVDKFYELDAKTKVYIQKNDFTNQLELGKRIMFNNKYVYKITEMEDIIAPGLFVLVCQRDEKNVMDDFENNIAWNGDSDTDITGELKITGEEEIKINSTRTYTSNLSVTWSVDDLSSVEIVEQSDKSIILKGLKANWVGLTATSGERKITKDILIYK